MRRKSQNYLLPMFAIALIGAAPKPTRPRSQLKIIVLDVEGGAATLYITPQGHSLLVDTGWPAGLGGPRSTPGQAPQPPGASSAQRIVGIAHANNLTRIDHVLVTHYHVDHVGGLEELITLIPVGEVIDHGPNREIRPAKTPASTPDYSPQVLYPKYKEATRLLRHRTLAAGEKLRIDNLMITPVNSDRTLIPRSMPGGGGHGLGCDTLENKGELGGEENPRSLGFVATWGEARILSLADTTWDVEQQLVCPRNRIGPIDLMFADNHGTDNSNSRALLATVKPRLVVVGNGRMKGAMPVTMRSLAAWPGYAGVWQLHYASRNTPNDNTSPDQIANLEGGSDAMFPLQLTVEASGAIIVQNPRTGSSIRYPRQQDHAARASKKH